LLGIEAVTKTKNSDERRGAPRFETALGGQLVSSRGSRHKIEITDLSAGGFSMALNQQSFMDSVGYAVKFAGLETLGAELRWAGRRDAGFSFDRPLHPAVVDHVVQANPPANDSMQDSQPTISSQGEPAV
jgi:hypothetical protein